MLIKIYTNLIYGGWSAKQLETGIGGSEEKLIEFAREMAKENEVIIYMNGEQGDFDGVKYRDHREFNPWESHDIFISFKNRSILINTINARKKFFFTTEIEGEWPRYLIDNVDNIVCISDYQKGRMRIKDTKVITQYLWADFNRMDNNECEKEKGTILYGSSFDRGLEELLVNWKLVQEKLKIKKLYITYGWDFMVNLIKDNPHLLPWKERMEELMKQGGVESLGRLSNDEMCKMYYKCQYWCLPLNNPDSELFCINAVKAQYANCIPVVRKIGALQETVNECINWDELLGRQNQKSTFNKKSIKNNRKFVEDNFSMNKQIQSWKELIQ